MSRRSSFRTATGYIRLVTHSLLHRKLRATLTVTGIVIGISIVLTLVFLGNGLQRSILRQLQQFGTDLIFVLPHEAANPLAGALGGGEFDDDHVDEVRALDDVISVMPVVSNELVNAGFRGEERTIGIEARPRELIQSFVVESLGVRVAEGRWMAREDSREIVLGANIAENGFRDPVRVGDTLDISGRRLEVVGILERFGDQVRDNIVVMTLGLYRDVTGTRDGYSGMLVKVSADSDIERTGNEIGAALSRQDDLEAYTVLTPEASEEAVSEIIGTVQSALFLIASIAVVVAGIGVMNTMYTSVLERTREIGVMKAVGARRVHIMAVFLIEAALLAGIGGALGALGGAGLALLVAAMARARGFEFFEAAVDPSIIIYVLIFTVLIGLVAGVLPAREAAKKKPVEALRY